MKIHFGDLFKNESRDKFGIRPRHAENAINNPDKRLAVTLEVGIEIVFYLKRIDVPRHPYYLLIDGRLDDDTYLMGMAWKIYPDLHPDIKHMNPLQILHEFTRQFGLEITIGDVRDYIIYDRVIPVATSQPTTLVAVNNPRKHSFVQSMMLRITEREGQTVAECALAYCIDSDKYLTWIKR